MRAAAVFIAMIVGLIAPMAQAFVLEGPHARPWPAQEDLARAARWDAGEGSLVGAGARGLGGGLEYAIDESLCERLRFIDSPPCVAIKEAVREAAARWSAGRPDLALVDVSGAVTAQAQGNSPSAIGLGAEIDFFAADAIEFVPFRESRTAAVTVYYFDTARRPLLTNGLIGETSFGVLTATDVRFSTETCYYLNAENERMGCAHFPSLVLHEIAHVFGIDHPDQRPDRNLDSDNDPVSQVVFDCLDPGKSLRVSERIEPRSAALANVWGANVWRQGLTLDDIAAREALYPRCPAAGQGRMVTAALPQQPAPFGFALPAPPIVNTVSLWGAFAKGANGALISIAGATDEADARRRVDEACSLLGNTCQTLAAFTECFAYAEDVRGAGVWGASMERGVSAARLGALSACSAKGGECAVRESFCAAP